MKVTLALSGKPGTLAVEPHERKEIQVCGAGSPRPCDGFACERLPDRVVPKVQITCLSHVPVHLTTVSQFSLGVRPHLWCG